MFFEKETCAREEKKETILSRKNIINSCAANLHGLEKVKLLLIRKPPDKNISLDLKF